MTTTPLALQANLYAALENDFACLHPTDTIPGLTFHPLKKNGLAAVQAFKLRPLGNTFISLVPDLATAQKFWHTLPDGWDLALSVLWPGPLSVIWQAAETAPPVLVSQAGTMAMRVPAWPPEKKWMAAFLTQFKLPLPSTSVNVSGEPAAQTWQAAKSKVAGAHGLFVPDFSPLENTTAPHSASTIIEILAAGSFAVRREGAMSKHVIEQALGQNK